MTTQPVFDPARSAAIRDLLAETVATDRRRPDRTKFAIIAGLTAIALALAGGTAALALTGVIHFGGPAPAPAPAPTVSMTPTPTPTPTPSPSGAGVQVQPFPVLPHDVSTVGTGSGWSLDLPGADDGCRMRPLTYDLANGLTVFLTGTRPKEYEGGTCWQHRNESIGLTLVDTARGDALWSRTWDFTSPADAPNSYQFQLLGTSGRALLDDGTGQSGPHDVIDLTTGKTVAQFDHRAFSGAISVPGGSGDIVLTTEPSGNGPATLTRVDPRDPDHPGWKTQVAAGYLQVADGTGDPTTLPVSFTAPGDLATSSRGSVDLVTGAVKTYPGISDYRTTMYFVTVWAEQAANGTTSFVGVDGSGERLWSRPSTPGSAAVEVVSPGTRPGTTFGRPSTGQLAIVDQTTVTVLDQLTGAVVWTAKGCATTDLLGVPTVISDIARDALSVRYAQDTSCSFDKNTGRALGDVGIPFDDFALFGVTNTYDGALVGDKGTAYDNATGRPLWSLPKAQGEQWLFAGGYLVRTLGNHVESID